MRTSFFLRTRRRFAPADLCFLGGMALILCIYIFRLPLGAAGNDEAFYLTIPQRLVQGDCLIADEWHGSQLYSLYTAPLLALRNLLFPTNEGLIVQYRYIYLFFHALTASGIYLRLRKRYGPVFGGLGALLLFLFTPYDIAALCYNTLGLDLVALTGVLLATAQSRRAYFFAGLTFAGAVLCTPHLMLAYVVFSVPVLIASLHRRSAAPALNWLFFTAGGALLAVLLIAFLLSRSSVHQLLNAFPQLFSDPEHPPISPAKKLTSFVNAFVFWGYPLMIELLVIIVAAADTSRRRHTLLYLLFGGICTLCMQAHCISELLSKTYNHILFPLAPLGLLAFILTEERDWRTFAFVYLGGLAYSFCIHLASNQGIYLITATAAVSSMAAILFFKTLLAELSQCPLSEDTAAAAAVLGVALICQLGLMSYSKINHKFWDSHPNNALSAVITQGPYKGARVSPEAADAYNAQLELYHRTLDPLPSGRVLFAGGPVWYHLVDRRFSNGAYSAWLSGTSNHTVDRLRTYYDLDPNHVPDYIFMPDGTRWDIDYFTLQIADAFGFVPSRAEGATLYTRLPQD